MSASIIATPAKLKSGAWGARVTLDILGKTAVRGELEGATCTIRTRAGKTWDATIEKVIAVFENDNQSVALCATRSVNPPPRKAASPTRSSSNGRSRGRLVGYHTHHHCSCGNWSGPGSPCLYSYGEAKDEGEAYEIEWRRE